jgi:hypothetical protein
VLLLRNQPEDTLVGSMLGCCAMSPGNGRRIGEEIFEQWGGEQNTRDV